jgi:rhamnogalacturonan endolyase
LWHTIIYLNVPKYKQFGKQLTKKALKASFQKFCIFGRVKKPRQNMKKIFLSIWLFISIFNYASEVCAKEPPKNKRMELAFGPDYDHLQLEKLGRGLIAIHQGNGNVTVGWRMLIDDKKKIAFNLYRKSYKPGMEEPEEVKLNDKPITDATFYLDRGVDTSITQEYVLRDTKNKKKSTAYRLTPDLAALPYISIPLPPIANDTTNAYLPNDASVGDLDGDGEYEIVLKRQVGNFACTQTGISGGTNRLEAYELDGTRLWHINIGINIREGAQYFSFMVYDFDGDGKAEVICKTSEGTIFGDGKKIGDANMDGKVDYRIHDSSLRTYGKILDGPEYISVIEGTTGKEMGRTDYITRGQSVDWGDDYGNRVDRQLSAVAYLDGKHPSYIMARGYNGRSVIEAWNFRGGKLSRVWSFDTHANNQKYIAWSNQGNHNIRIGDVDHDGCDEIMYGACAIDHDGTGLYTTGWGHGDAMHLLDIDPDKQGLEVWQCHEYAPNPNGSSLRNAATGKLLVGFPSTEDVGRSMCADIDPEHRGCEIWSSATNGVYSAKGKLLSKNTPSINQAVWWDGDVSRELLDKFYIEKWTGDGTTRIFNGKGKGITWCNGTKATPCLSADIFGDWREEVIWPTVDGKEIRIYSTNFPTALRFTTFMQDPIYRLGVATENVGYNQPPHTGFFLEVVKTSLLKTVK